MYDKIHYNKNNNKIIIKNKLKKKKEPYPGPVQVKDGPGVVDWVNISHRRG